MQTLMGTSVPHRVVAVRALASRPLERLAGVMGQVFCDGPGLRFILPNDRPRRTLAKGFCAAAIRRGLYYGEVYTTESLDAAAIWIPPGELMYSPLQRLRTGALAVGWQAGWAAIRRYSVLAAYINEAHRRSVLADHWYLLMVAVTPEKQGRGIGTALLEPVLVRADRERVPCYLDTLEQRNLGYYERLGFRVTVQGQVPYGGPRFWGMARTA